MLEICAGSYLFLIILAGLFFWSSLRVAQRADLAQSDQAHPVPPVRRRRIRRFVREAEA